MFNCNEVYVVIIINKNSYHTHLNNILKATIDTIGKLLMKFLLQIYSNFVFKILQIYILSTDKTRANSL